MQLNFIVTDRCTIKCDFCAPGCGPNTRAALTEEQMITIYSKLDRIKEVPLVVFTGGEPLIYSKIIANVIRFIRRNSRSAIRIVTNAFWAINYKRCKELLVLLKEAGLSEINYSVDDFHQEHIPLSAIKNAVDCALELRIPILLAHKRYPNSKSDRKFYEDSFGLKIPDLSGLKGDEILHTPIVFSSGYTLPIGRGSDRIDQTKWFSDEDISRGSWKGPCTEVLKSISISANGFLSPCCGLVDRNLSVFYVANVFDYDLIDILEYANKTTLYNWLSLEGPSSLMEFIQKKNPKIKFINRYVQNCQLCQEIFSDNEKSEIILKGLDEIAPKLCIERCIYESYRTSVLKMHINDKVNTNAR